MIGDEKMGDSENSGDVKLTWEPAKPAAVNPEIWGSRRGIELVGIIVIALAVFAGLDLVVMTAIYVNRGELPDIFGTLATIALSALAGVIGGLMQLVAMRNLAVGGKSFVVGQVIDDVGEKRIAALVRDGFAAYVQPKEEFVVATAVVDEEIEELDPEKVVKRVRK